jgi:hypothetical protein
MRAAKLFAALAILQLGLAVVERRTPSGIDIYFHATYFVVGQAYSMGFLALTSALFALVYAASHWVSHPLNSSLGLTHFVFALAAILFLHIAVFTMDSANGLPASATAYRWVSLGLWAGPCCFLLGCATLAVNCVWTGISVLRVHKYASSR